MSRWSSETWDKCCSRFAAFQEFQNAFCAWISSVMKTSPTPGAREAFGARAGSVASVTFWDEDAMAKSPFVGEFSAMRCAGRAPRDTTRALADFCSIAPAPRIAPAGGVQTSRLRLPSRRPTRCRGWPARTMRSGTAISDRIQAAGRGRNPRRRGGGRGNRDRIRAPARLRQCDRISAPDRRDGRR
jgi:hypothetical protein